MGKNLAKIEAKLQIIGLILWFSRTKVWNSEQNVDSQNQKHLITIFERCNYPTAISLAIRVQDITIYFPYHCYAITDAKLKRVSLLYNNNKMQLPNTKRNFHFQSKLSLSRSDIHRCTNALFPWEGSEVVFTISTTTPAMTAIHNNNESMQ